MATTRSVSVLTPNGRRSVVKVSPNTTIIQVLEEVCQEYKFIPDHYDLRHYNRILDINLVFRYANIPNNASLEMIKCKIPRKLSNVTICIQLESGDRLTGVFPPTENIENIFKQLTVEYNVESAVVVYTQREIYGKYFATVTLKSLGLVGGKALFRLLHRDPEKLKEQAHVYVPSKPNVSKSEENEEEKPKSKPASIINSNKNKIIDPVSIIKAEKQSAHSSKDTIVENTIKSKFEENKKDENKVCASTSVGNQVKMEEETPIEVDGNPRIEVKKEEEPQIENEPQVHILGERSALLFNQSCARSVHQADIPDEFFELTVDDAKTLFRDAKKMVSTHNDFPLLTSALRELEKDKQKLNRLHKYPKTIIRIQFPNALVLQGLFNPVETVQTVKDFVKSYLEYPESDFSLYTAPPKCDLNAEDHLIDLDLVPSAIVYYAGTSDLKPDIKYKLTDPTAVNKLTVKTRSNMIRKDTESMIVDESEVSAHSSTSATVLRPVDSISNGSIEPQPGPSRPQPEKSQAPKWFKLSSK
ncbi:hypothetical protein TSAR_007650 [Trichomalopsis sarcophagae]|uniref:UBX domain-containing protein n=1 Tax=Trichomalopsis sarcophagae TaxID=543379 RepID=A0A232EVF6_9HYME|nr:hypothetical protein TSAR_007650 [Trichomalopsis sarcophagae]